MKILTRAEVEERLAAFTAPCFPYYAPRRLPAPDDPAYREYQALFTCEQLAGWLKHICPQVEYFNPDTLPSEFRPVIDASAWLEGRS